MQIVTVESADFNYVGNVNRSFIEFVFKNYD